MTETANGKEKPREILSDKKEIIIRSREKGSLEGVGIQNVNFDKEIFNDEVDFAGAIFCDGVSFQEAWFKYKVDFRKAHFKAEANFKEAQFEDKNNMPNFEGAHFKGKANFEAAQFNGKVSFGGARFFGPTFWGLAKFKGKASFLSIQFNAEALFIGAIFENQVLFVGVKEKEANICVFSRQAETTFYNTYFAKPERALFKQVYLGKTSFLDTDISKIDFTDVDWAKCKKNLFGYSKRIIYDELKARKVNKNYVLVEKLYQQLKLNFEAKGDYREAGYFHWGEMEMRRLQKKWFMRKLSFNALYKCFSGYGEWPRLALCWLLLIIFALPGFYLLSGMKATTGNNSVEYIFTGNPFDLNLKLLGDYFKAFWYSVHNLTLSRKYNFSPMGWGANVAVFQKVAGLILATLFTLALKRKFKR